MLLDHIVGYCDREFKTCNQLDICDNCTHPYNCSGSCSNCLDEIHFPYNYPQGKREYDCKNIINYYVCKYSYKYCSEIEYALNNFNGLDSLDHYKIMSIGCGAAPDLMAFEHYLTSNRIKSPVEYMGYDINKLWIPIHAQIDSYFNKKVSLEFKYVDAVEFFTKYYVKNVNILVLQYVISYFYNTNQVNQIETFFDDLVDSIVSRKTGTMFIIINDVNSCYRGRDFFIELYQKIKDNDFHGKRMLRYFDYNIKSDKQRYGIAYDSYNCLHGIPKSICNSYDVAKYCSSAQLLIEVRA